ncbi:MAG: hypothetical protein BGO98_01785 [Myxococcales bacterium 68-20]|nr:histidinol-phosphate aminotransferase family protein [Myxococcales bacterium]OJY19996.1 MAG: hypothetical protein BGO98_01785 [Myxococcales bacterium 68-20]
MNAPLTPYAVPRPSVPIDLWLDANEGEAPPLELLDALRAAGGDALRRYPDARPLEAKLAARLGLAAEQVLVTPGADEALDRACRAHLGPGKRILLAEPTFEMLSRYARLADAEVDSFEWVSGPFPVEAALARTTPATALVVVVTPNNPTGAVATASDLERLSAAAPDAIVIVDLAYVEFADEDLTARALAMPNVLVTRTLSKAWGLAGLRVGYVAGPRPIIDVLRATGSPFGVSSPSLLLAEAWVERGEERVRSFVDRIRCERAELTRILATRGATPLPSQANFVLARFADAEAVHDALAASGISVRIFPRRASLEGCLRITCPGNAADFARLTRALEAALSASTGKETRR